MAFHKILAVTAVRYSDGKRAVIHITRFNVTAWKASKDLLPGIDHIDARVYPWTARNFRRIRAAMPADWRVTSGTLHLPKYNVFRSRWGKPKLSEMASLWRDTNRNK